MTFEEDFPSLELVYVMQEHDHKQGDIITSWEKATYLLPKDVKKYCFDKQKVRDILEKYRKREGLQFNVFDKIEKELGL